MASGSLTDNFLERTFEQKWVIKNWENTTQNEELLRNTSTEIRCKVEDVECAKFLVGFTIFQDRQYRMLRFNWKLLRKLYCMDTVDTGLRIQFLDWQGNVVTDFQSQANAEIGKTVDINTNFWEVGTPEPNPADYTNTEGSMVVLVEITFKNLPKVLCYSKPREFKKACKIEYKGNLAALLNQKLCSDIKILTKDKTELFVHKAILSARCPVFASMLESDFLEKSIGIIYVNDISAKTMKVLLNYWYTGDLQPTWTDDDTVVEFTYAAGKYQMTPILKMLDNSIGADFKASDVDIDLLRMVQKLSLKNAKTKLLKRVVGSITQSKNGTELLNMFSLATDNFDDGNFTVSQVLKLFDGVLSENIDKKACPRDIMLIALA